MTNLKHERSLATAGLEVMTIWDFREYMFSLENLKENLTPALRYSWQCLAAATFVKAVQLYFWPSPEPKVVGWALTGLTVYHAGFTLAYRWFLHLIGRCQRHTEQLAHNVKELLRQRVSEGTYREGGVEDLSEDDVRAWCGREFRVLNYVASNRAVRSDFYQSGPVWGIFEFFAGWYII
ncbi:predicted protein [Chaetomium globosum CBS 148.51]|uniref:Uncharacterized protein n=1 Tax=Chaetomium globosum (strain ATCC 6205 / CBS 148.51 / DSM 1962 / NBRC 6347 / NRRL 1970) TaxID=306901 RepID=Q2HDG4_CHAGB|nr:uncharacterized protein CHGG_01740 [Chaetomium globosum CBS 148.51]EAQ93505.1 predicted protein [Chaetomium globosum CBS 148.51]